MGRCIIKLSRGGEDWYMEWSTVSDGPGWGYCLETFKLLWGERFGSEGLRELEERLVRVEAKGTSMLDHKNVDETIAFNRAGPKGGCLTKNQIIDRYCTCEVSEDD